MQRLRRFARFSARALSAFSLTLAAATTLADSPATPGADAKFTVLSQRYVAEFGKYSPVSATQLGDHRFDADLDDVGATGRARALAWTKELLGQLQGIDRARLSRANQVDGAVLENQLRYAAWPSRTATPPARWTRASARSSPSRRFRRLDAAAG